MRVLNRAISRWFEDRDGRRVLEWWDRIGSFGDDFFTDDDDCLACSRIPAHD